MTAQHQHEARRPWIAPATFRAGLEDLEQISGLLLDEVAGQVVVAADDVSFLARRLNRLARDLHRALPSDVT